MLSRANYRRSSPDDDGAEVGVLPGFQRSQIPFDGIVRAADVGGRQPEVLRLRLEGLGPVFGWGRQRVRQGVRAVAVEGGLDGQSRFLGGRQLGREVFLDDAQVQQVLDPLPRSLGRV